MHLFQYSICNTPATRFQHNICITLSMDILWSGDNNLSLTERTSKCNNKFWTTKVLRKYNKCKQEKRKNVYFQLFNLSHKVLYFLESIQVELKVLSSGVKVTVGWRALTWNWKWYRNIFLYSQIMFDLVDYTQTKYALNELN